MPRSGLRDHLQQFVSVVEATELRSHLAKLAEASHRIRSGLAKVAQSSNAQEIVNAVVAGRDIAQGTARDLTTFPPRRVHRELDALRATYVAIAPEVGGDGDSAEQRGGFAPAIDKFENAYEHFLTQAQAAETAIRLVFVGAQLNTSLYAVYSTAKAVLEALTPSTTSDRPDERPIEMFFPEILTVREVLAKFDALRRLYSFGCEALQVSEDEHPLEVAGMETGSVWVKVIGQKQVVGFVLTCLTAGGAFLYRNHTAEGRVRGIESRAHALEMAVHVREELHKQGLGSPHLDRSLTASGEAIADSLRVLLGDESRLEVDGKPVLPDPGSAPKRVRTSKPLLRLSAGEEQVPE